MRFPALLILALGVLAPQDDEKRVRDLVQQLNADDLSQREQAREQLLKFGPRIAKTLEAQLTGAPKELVAQVQSILDRFRWEETIGRTLPPVALVTIPKGTHTPEKILKAIEDQTGLKVTPCAINLRAAVEGGWDRAPALAVLDDVCRRLGARLDAPSPLSDGDDDFQAYRNRPVRRLLIDGEKAPVPAAAHSGPFRITVEDVMVTEHRTLESTEVTARVFVALSAQPGTSALRVGRWQVVEVVDDTGASLRLDDAADPFDRDLPEPGDDAEAVSYGGDRWRRLDASDNFAIKAPAAGARTLKSVKLKIRMAFGGAEVSREFKVADFKDKAEMTIAKAGITVTKVGREENAFVMEYDIAGKFEGSPAFELLDADGRPVPNHGGGSQSSGAHTRRSWSLPKTAAVAAVRVKARVGQRIIEVPFELADVPLPVEKQ